MTLRIQPFQTQWERCTYELREAVTECRDLHKHKQDKIQHGGKEVGTNPTLS